MSASERQDEEQMPRETGTRQGRTPPTGDPHRGEDPAEDPPPEGRATQGTHTEHTDTPTRVRISALIGNETVFRELEPGNAILTLRVGYAEENKNSILFIFSMFCECITKLYFIHI